MATNIFPTPNNLVLNGQIPDPHKTFLFGKIPLSLYAADDGVTFTVFQKQKFSKTVPYEELRSASTSNFLWRKKVVIYSNAGIESIRCFGSREDISEFCKFVNNKVTARRKPFGPRFQLTRLEAPPEQKFQLGENVPREYDSAIDFLFDPEKWTDDILDKLEREISLSGPEVSSAANRWYRNDVRRKDLNSVNPYNLFGYKNDNVWNLYVTKKHLKNTVLILLIIILGITSAWQLGELPGMKPASLTTAVEKNSVIPPKAIAPPEPIKPNVRPRALEQLVEIMQDDEKYRRVVDVLKQKRTLLGLSTEDIETRLAWEKSFLENVESENARLTVTELIEYSLFINKDIYDLMEEVK